MQFGGYILLVDFEIGINIKDLRLVYSMSFELNWQQIYKGVKFLCSMDERYAGLKSSPLSLEAS